MPTAKITDLISFDDEPAPAPAASSSSTSILDDFASLTFGDTPAAASVAPSSSANANATLSRGPGGLPANLFDPSKMSQPLAGAGTAPAFGQWGALQLPTSSTSSAQGMSQSQSGTSLNQASLQPSAPGAQPATSQPATNANGQSKDPFADLDGLF